MVKRKSKKKDDFPIGNISPEGYIARIATGTGTKTSKTNTVKRFFEGE
jgi:hypothetical protein